VTFVWSALITTLSSIDEASVVALPPFECVVDRINLERSSNSSWCAEHGLRASQSMKVIAMVATVGALFWLLCVHTRSEEKVRRWEYQIAI
jgi:hypothetical protein